MNETEKPAYYKKIQHVIQEAIHELQMILLFDNNGIIRYINESFTAVTQYKKEELSGTPAEVYFAENFSQLLTETDGMLKSWTGEMKQKKKDGTYYWTELTLLPLKSEDGDPVYAVIQHDITGQKKREWELEKLAYQDPLTGLPNRNQMEKWIQNDPELFRKEMTVLFIDIDYFRTINDNFGHAIGDRVLKTIAERLTHCIKEESFLFRYDGEEFILLLENQPMETINKHLHRILEVIRKPIHVDRLELLVTASIGISCGRPSAALDGDVLSGIEDLIKMADNAMYHAKKEGGNKFHFHSGGQSRELERTYQIEIEIREALERKEFSMVYQPLINLKTNKIVGVESLLRWDNRLLGKVSPGEFIPILEGSGLIVPVGKWILKTVCTQMKIWQEDGLFLQRVSVNVSPLQFRDPHFIQNLKEILHDAELDASYLELEITEGTLLDIEDSAKKLHDLRELGVKVSIDDFGTGYSSLSYLKQLPIDTLKIDKSFIDDLDRDGKIIVNTIISMGKNLQFRVIAEGIENSDQFKYLQEQQCHEGQGYFFSRPVESDKIEELYHSLQ